MRSVSVGKVIQLPVMRLGSIGRMVFCLFHTRAWWQQELRVRVTMVSHDSKGATCRPNLRAMLFLMRGVLMLLKMLVMTPKGSTSANIQAGG